MLSQVDDKTSAVVVINASGIIQMTNKTLQKMYGYRASELEGQNVSILMPAPFSTRHNGYIAAYLATGTPTEGPLFPTPASDPVHALPCKELQAALLPRHLTCCRHLTQPTSNRIQARPRS